AEVQGQEISSVIHHEELKRIISETHAQERGGYEIDIELHETRQRSPRVLRARTAVVDDRWGEPLGAITLIQDVTRLREVDRLKTELLTTAAHELRTPLTSILGFSELLLNRAIEPARQQNYLRLIHEQSVHLSKIIQDLLDVSRLEARRGLELKLEPIDMAELLRQVLQPLLETEPRYEFKTEGLDYLPQVKGDAFRLTQVARNLLSNAIKYSPDGGVITVSSRAEATQIEIRIRDEGIGLTTEQMEPLFKPFYRADVSN